MKSTSLIHEMRKINPKAISGDKHSFDIKTSWSNLHVEKIGRDYWEASMPSGHYRTGTAKRIKSLVKPYLKD